MISRTGRGWSVKLVVGRNERLCWSVLIIAGPRPSLSNNIYQLLVTKDPLFSSLPKYTPSTNQEHLPMTESSGTRAQSAPHISFLYYQKWCDLLFFVNVCNTMNVKHIEEILIMASHIEVCQTLVYEHRMFTIRTPASWLIKAPSWQDIWPSGTSVMIQSPTSCMH